MGKNLSKNFFYKLFKEKIIKTLQRKYYKNFSKKEL